MRGVTGWFSAHSVGLAGDPKVEGSNPVRRTRKKLKVEDRALHKSSIIFHIIDADDTRRREASKAVSVRVDTIVNILFDLGVSARVVKVTPDTK